MNKQPLLILWICFIFGILISEKLSLSTALVHVFLSFSFLFLVFCFLKIHFFFKIKEYVLSIFFLGLGVFAHELNNKEQILPNFPSSSEVVFTLDKKLNSNEKNKRYEVKILKVNDEINHLGLVLSVPKEEKELDFKHFYKAEIYLNKVEANAQDFGFDYQKYLARKHIYFQGYAPNSFQVAEKENLTFSEKIKQKRLEVLQNIDQAKLSEKSKEFTKGIILADRTEMDRETVEDFSKSGLVHILAISGSHMAIIFWLILLLLKPLFPARLRNVPIVISLIFIWLFAIFIDFGSSVIRSCIMITAYYFYVLLQRKPDLLHAMAISGLAILIFDTNQLFDVGFQLSFIAVFGIFWLNEPILKYLPKPKNTVQNFLVNVVSISIAAQVATLPLVIYYFHQYSLISILANLIIIPFSEIIIISSLVMTALLVFKIDFSLFNLIYDFMVNTLLSAIKWFANLDFAFFKNIPMTLLEASLLLLSFYFLRDVLLKKDFKSAVRFSYGMLIFFALRISLNFYHYQRDEVLATNYFRDNVLVSKHHGEAVFYIREKSKPDKIEKYIVEPYLNSRRIKDFKIETVKPNVSAVKIGKKVYKLDD